MCWLKCSLALLALSFATANSWDIAITASNQIQYYNESIEEWTGDKKIKSADITALAYDAVHNMLLYVDKKSDNTSIYGYYLSTMNLVSLVGRNGKEDIKGLAFDPVTGMIFWTDNQKIMWKLKNSTDPNVYGRELNVTYEIGEQPRAVAVDSCRGYIYWTNTNYNKPTISRALFNGSQKEVIIETDGQPMSIAIDQQERKLYWISKNEGIHYTIEKSDLDGKYRQIVYKGEHHRPNSLTVSKDYLYWTDTGFYAVWKLHKTKQDIDPASLLIVKDNENIFGIVANYSIEDQTHGVSECQELRKFFSEHRVIEETDTGFLGAKGLFCLNGKEVEGKGLKCNCYPGFTGERCEINKCQNYCLQGDCSTVDGEARCSCKPGFKGERCEIAIQKPVKDRMEPQKDLCNCTSPIIPSSLAKSSETLAPIEGVFVNSCDNNDWDPVRDPLIMFFGALSTLLSVACAYLIRRVMQLKKRPRIKKRIIVQKNSTPLTARPDQCEITIENCCNMNICETPCFEPRSTIRPNLCDAKPGKEEKKNLISNMELPDDY